MRLCRFQVCHQRPDPRSCVGIWEIQHTGKHAGAGLSARPEAGLNILWDNCSFDDYEKNFATPDTLLFDIAARRPGHPTDMAGLVLYFASDDACYTTGQVVCVDGGWTAGLSGDY